MGRTFQTLQVFGQLSVRDNLIVAAQEFKGTLPGRLFAAPDATLCTLAAEPGIEGFPFGSLTPFALRAAQIA